MITTTSRDASDRLRTNLQFELPVGQFLARFFLSEPLRLRLTPLYKKKLGPNKEPIEVISQNKERYISFSKHIEVGMLLVVSRGKKLN